jgi:hypothetical protein
MKKIFVILFSVTSILMFTACAQKNKVTTSWVDPSFKEYGANNILVMGVSKDETHLKLYENVFVDQFSKTDVQAMASHKVIGHVLEPDRDIVEAAVKKSGASSVLITHLVDSKLETHIYPGSVHFQPSGFYGYYGRTYHSVYTPPSHVSRTVVRLESNLYDVSTSNLVWSAQSETINPKLLRTDFERIVGPLIADMKKKGVVQ